MQQREVTHHDVERTVAERQRLRAPGTEVQPGMPPTGEGDHRRGDVHPHHRRPTPRRAGSDRTRAAADIENPHARPNPGGCQQRLDQPAGDRGEEPVVAGSPVLACPPGRLEGVERVRVELRARRGGTHVADPLHAHSPYFLTFCGIFCEGPAANLAGNNRPRRHRDVGPPAAARRLAGTSL
jgi:hypothetical protein